MNWSIKNSIKKIISKKNIRNLQKIKRSFAEIVGLRTFHVLIDTNNCCNLSCSFCTRENGEIIRMSSDEFSSVLNKIHKKTLSLQLSCAWEYSFAKNAPELIRILGEYKIPKTTVYSNGNILSSDLIDALISSKINNYVVSIGEAKKDTYEKLRKGGNFERVIKNIKNLKSAKINQNSKLPKICANLTVTETNIKELLDFVSLAKEIGIEEIRGRHLILNKKLNIDQEVIKDIDKANKIISDARIKAKSFGIGFDVPIYQMEHNKKDCVAPWQQLYISSNGNVSVCPRIHMYENIGNILNSNLRKIERGEKLYQFRNKFEIQNYNNPVCQICNENKESEIPIDQGF